MSYDELGLDKIGDRKTAVFFTISDTTPPTISLLPWPFRRCSTCCVSGRTMFTGAACPIVVRVLWDEGGQHGAGAPAESWWP